MIHRKDSVFSIIFSQKHRYKSYRLIVFEQNTILLGTCLIQKFNTPKNNIFAYCPVLGSHWFFKYFSPTYFSLFMGDLKLSRRRFFKKIAPLPAEASAKAGSSTTLGLSASAKAGSSTPQGLGASAKAGSSTPSEISVKIEHIPDLFTQASARAGTSNQATTDFSFAQELTLQGGLNPYQGPWTKAEAAHLLRRTTFGLKKAHLDQMLALGNAAAAVDAVLNVPTTPPAPPINNYNTLPNNQNPYMDPEVPSGTTWVNAPYDVNAEGFRIESWRGWWINRMVDGDANIQEKMTLFWHNHFATKSDAVFFGRPVYKHNQMLRANALGNFKAFVKAVTLDPLMLRFLNGYLNVKSAPDENYARELQELFTVGKESANTYSEDDVLVAARVLTGWGLDANGDTVFRMNLHDAGPKVFSAFYNTILPGDDDGNAELDAMLNMIFQKEEVSLFICREIYRFFIYYKIDAAVENEVIVPLAQVFRDNNYEILPVMRTLLLSEHFFDAVNKGCQIKNPLDLTIGVLRNFNLSLLSPTLYDQYFLRLSLNYFCGALQMLPGDPPNVAGWQAYRQSPNYYRNWISSDTIRNRNVLTDVLSFVGVNVGTDKLIIDHIAFAGQFSNPEDPNALIDDILSITFPMPISVLKKTFLKSILLSGQTSDHYWTDAWNAHINNPFDPMAYQTVWFRLASLHKYVMNLAEYQLI
jgi:uncharacterized protein (DUF1800 family)